MDCLSRVDFATSPRQASSTRASMGSYLPRSRMHADHRCSVWVPPTQGQRSNMPRGIIRVSSNGGLEARQKGRIFHG